MPRRGRRARPAAGLRGARLRIPRALRQSPGRLRAIDADVDGDAAGLAVCGGTCVNFLSLRRSAGAWRVTAHHIGAYA